MTISKILRIAEFTTMAGRRLREAVKETLISNGNGEFNDNNEVVVAGLTNTYSQYVATFEEYKQQRYDVLINNPFFEDLEGNITRKKKKRGLIEIYPCCLH